MDYGKLQCNILDILDAKGISKNQICKDLDIPRTNFNRYCNNNFQRIDAALICKLCTYLDVEVGVLITHIPTDIDEQEKVGCGIKRRTGYCMVVNEVS